MPRKRLKLIPQMGREPALDFGYAHAFAASVVCHLIPRDAVDGEVTRLWMGKAKQQP